MKSMDTSHNFHEQELLPETTLMQRIQEKLAESRFLTFSILFHVILLVMIGGVVVVKNMAKQDDFAAEGGSGLVDAEVAAVPQPPEQQVTQTQTFTPTAPSVTAPSVDVIVAANSTTSKFSMAMPAPVAMKAPSTDTLAGATKMPSAKGNGLGKLPASMAARAGGTARADAMRKTGGKEKSDKAVLAGLRWLVKNQNPDGSWSPTYTPSMTGLALLCFLGHGETPEAPEFGPTVKKGIDWLLTKGTQFQGRLSMANTFTQQGVYEHGIAAYALGEYYTMTKDERVKDVFSQAIAHIIQGQAPDGGWQYAYAKGPDSDTSVTGWQIQALKAAHLSLLNLPGVDESLDKAMLDLKRVNGPKGGFGYRTAADTYSLTGAGVLCTYFWKGDKDKVVKEGIKFIIDETDKNFPIEYNGKTANLYAWYYHTQACLMFGGSAWNKWNKWFQDVVTDAQTQKGPDEGSWPVMANKAVGPQAEEKGAGPFYRTTLCILMLEVYYRYMPTNKM